ncbi:MAG: hypothetical protein LBT47_01195 [Deltaproteobacteria bacterium]|jgi:hypothetical protein|nr:hypothetical protein [Deltaproteobacteria bacterium]
MSKATNAIVSLRNWFAKHPEGDLADCLEVFDLNRAVIKALHQLQLKGELEIAREYTYFGPKSPEAATAETTQEVKQTAMWRAIRGLAKVGRVVDLNEVGTIAEVSARYLKRYVLFLEHEGYVARRPTGLAVLDKAMRAAETPLLKKASQKTMEGDRRLLTELKPEEAHQ